MLRNLPALSLTRRTFEVALLTAERAAAGIGSIHVEIVNVFHGLTASTYGVCVGVASRSFHSHTKVKQAVIRLVFANNQRRLIRACAVSMMHDCVRWKWPAKSQFRFDAMCLFNTTSALSVSVAHEFRFQWAVAMSSEKSLWLPDPTISGPLGEGADSGGPATAAFTEFHYAIL